MEKIDHGLRSKKRQSMVKMKRREKRRGGGRKEGKRTIKRIIELSGGALATTAFCLAGKVLDLPPTRCLHGSDVPIQLALSSPCLVTLPTWHLSFTPPPPSSLYLCPFPSLPTPSSVSHPSLTLGCFTGRELRGNLATSNVIVEPLEAPCGTFQSSTVRFFTRAGLPIEVIPNSAPSSARLSRQFHALNHGHVSCISKQLFRNIAMITMHLLSMGASW